jgi:hypothetical protein
MVKYPIEESKIYINKLPAFIRFRINQNYQPDNF